MKRASAQNCSEDGRSMLEFRAGAEGRGVEQDQMDKAESDPCSAHDV